MPWNLLAFSLAAAVFGRAPTTDTVLQHERYSLANGLDVVLHEDRRYPIVEVRVVYHVGSMHDPPGKEGVAHLLEHAMFSGSMHVEPGEHWRHLYAAGASLANATTSYSSTAYYEHVPASKVAVALWLESDRMGFFEVAKHHETLADERRIITQELDHRLHRGDAEAAEAELWNLVVPEGHPLHMQDARSLEHITPADVQAASDRWYGPKNATLIVAGALPKDVKALIERYFGTLSGGERSRAEIPPLELPASRQKLVETRAARAPAALVAWPSPGRYAPGDAEGDVLAAVLQADALRGPDSTGATNIAGIHALQWSESGQSIFYVRVDGYPGESPHALLAGLDRALQTIARGELPEPQLRAAKKRRLVSLHRALGSLRSRVELIQSYVAAGKSPDSFAEDRDRYAKITKEGVATFVRRTLVGRPRAVVLVAPLPGESR